MLNGFCIEFTGKGTASQMIDLGGGIGKAHHIIQEEIVEGIGTYQILRLLITGQQFRADGGIHNIQQILLGRCKCLGLSQIFHHTTDQRLGNGTVDGIHTHMVAIIGTPAQRQLTQVTGTHHDAANNGRIVHQDLGTLTGLGIFIHRITNRLIVADIRKMLPHSGGNVHFLDGNTQGLSQLMGIGSGTAGGTKARHDQGVDILGFPTGIHHGANGNQHSQRRIQSAGKAQHGYSVDSLQTALQTGGLDLEDRTAVVHYIGLGNKGIGIDRIAAAIGTQGIASAIDDTHRLHITIEGSGITDGLILAAGSAHLTQVRIHHQHLLFHQTATVFHQHIAGFRNDAMAAEHQILHGFGATGGAIGIHAGANIRLMLHQLDTGLGLACHFIGSGQIGHHFCAIDGQQRGRGQRRPQIFADLHTQNAAVAHFEQQVTAHGHIALTLDSQILQGHLPGLQVLGRGEPAALGEFTVVGQVGLGHQAAEDTAGDHCGAVVHLTLHHSRGTHHSRHLGVLGRTSHNGLQAAHTFLQQGILEEQVSASVAGQGKLGKYDQVAA